VLSTAIVAAAGVSGLLSAQATVVTPGSNARRSRSHVTLASNSAFGPSAGGSAAHHQVSQPADQQVKT
jgi:hypothetical protein